MKSQKIEHLAKILEKDFKNNTHPFKFLLRYRIAQPKTQNKDATTTKQN